MGYLEPHIDFNLNGKYRSKNESTRLVNSVFLIKIPGDPKWSINMYNITQDYWNT